MSFTTEEEQIARKSLENTEWMEARANVQTIDGAQLHATIAVAYATLAAVDRLHRIATLLEPDKT